MQPFQIVLNFIIDFNVFQVCRREKEAGRLFVPISSVTERAAYLTGASERTMYRLQNKGQETRERKEMTPKFAFDDFDKSVVQRTVGNIVRARHIIPTLADIQEELKIQIGYSGGKETLRKLLKSLGFRWRATQTNRSALMERTDVAASRIQYLRQIQKYREEGRTIVYTDETFVHTSHSAKRSWQSEEFAMKVPFSKGSRYIIVHAGSVSGFIDGAELIFKAKTTTGDYHNEMNSSNFMKWLQNQLIPNLQPNTVLVVDNAPYHTVQEDKCPTTSTTKPEMRSWLSRNGVQYTDAMLKTELLQLCKTNRPKPKYILDSVLEAHGHTCLRLPPYHAELNPIELIWATVKGAIAKRNTTFKAADMMPLIHEAFQKIGSTEWEACCRHVRLIEDKYRATDIVKDNEIESIIIAVCSSDEDTDTGSDCDNYSDTDTAPEED